MMRKAGLCLLLFLALGLAGCSGGGEPVKATLDDKGVQHVQITVKGGYHPSHIVAQAGKPLVLEFYRDEPDSGQSCEEYVDIPALKIHERLSGYKTEAIEVPPQPAGTLDFHCGMNMVKGQVTFR